MLPLCWSQKSYPAVSHYPQTHSLWPWLRTTIGGRLFFLRIQFSFLIGNVPPHVAIMFQYLTFSPPELRRPCSSTGRAYLSHNGNALVGFLLDIAGSTPARYYAGSSPVMATHFVMLLKRWRRNSVISNNKGSHLPKAISTNTLVCRFLWHFLALF